MSAIIAMKKRDLAQKQHDTAAVFSIWQRKVIAALFSATAFLCAGLLYFASFTMAANENTAADVYVIDNLWDGTAWLASEVGTTLSREEYDASDVDSAANETDRGYLSMRRETTRAGAVYTVSTNFDEPINLYEYQSIELSVKADTPVLPKTGTNAGRNIDFMITVDIHSTDDTITTSRRIYADVWTSITVPMSGWSGRTQVTGVSVAIKVVSSFDGVFSLSWQLDNITSKIKADTSHEDTFMTSQFLIKKGSYTSEPTSGYIKLSAGADGIVSLAAKPVFADTVSAPSYNAIRIVAESTETDVYLSVTYAYKDGTTNTTDVKTVKGRASRGAYYFDVPNLSSIESFTLTAENVIDGNLNIYSISPHTLPVLPETGIGALESCKVSADGSVTLKGTVPFDAAGDYINGKIAIYAIPSWADEREYMATAEPCAEIKMTTRFSVTIDASSLPAGYLTYKYAAAVIYDGTSLQIGSPMYISNPSLLGSALPSAISEGIKGLCGGMRHCGLCVSATIIDVDLAELLGTSSGGRLYTFGGEIYYFDSAFISQLDTLIRRYSLTGARVYIRLLCTDPGLFTGDVEDGVQAESALYYALRADTEQSFGILYAAVDFLTSRYRSSEYGYIAGMIAGAYASDAVSKNNPGTDVTPVEYARLLEGAMRLIYEVGCANISNFEVYLPIGPILCAGSGIDGGAYDAMHLLRTVSSFIKNGGAFDYRVLWQSPLSSSEEYSGAAVYVGADNIEILANYFDRLENSGLPAPGGAMFYWRPEGDVNISSLASGYVSGYYSVAKSPFVSAFILAPDEMTISDADWDVFISVLRYIDTDKYSSAASILAQAIGSNAWRIIMALDDNDPDAYRARQRSIVTGSVVQKPSADFTGSYTYFNFSSVYDTRGWLTYDGCKSLVSASRAGGRVLRASFGGGVGGILYSSLSFPLDFSPAPVIRFDITLVSGSDADTNITIEFMSEGGFYITEAMLTAGVENAVYIDLTEYKEKDKIYAISIYSDFTAGDEIYISKITGYSSQYTSDELESMIKKNPGTISDTGDNKYGDGGFITPLAVVFIIIVVSGAVFIALRRRS